MKTHTLLTVTLTVASTIGFSSAHASPVKLSSSNICHDESSSFYERTRNYTPFDSVEACVEAGGRLPYTPNSATQQVTASQQAAQQESAPPSSASSVVNRGNDYKPYDRRAFKHWTGFCPNTRHQILKEQSTALVTTYTNISMCTVDMGRWIDAYSGKTYYKASQLDVDHVVPLAYSWPRGSHNWDDEKRERFANDNANLIITSARLNRQKGAAGPTEWLPPNEEYICQYLLRFDRVMKTYKLNYFPQEAREMEQLKRTHC